MLRQLSSAACVCSLFGRASDLAAGLAHPVPALFHCLFKVRPPLPRCGIRCRNFLNEFCGSTPAAFAAASASTRSVRLPCTQTLAVLVYLFGGWASASFVNIFIICTLLLAADFWTVKNVTGRLMVGLRWNSVVEDDGRTTWKFEAQEVRVAAPRWATAGRPSTARHRRTLRPRPRAATPSSRGALHRVRTRLTPRASRPDGARVAPARVQEGLRSTSLDIAVFWVGLFAPAVVWIFFGIGSFLRFNFEWLLLIMTALSLSFANIVGYVRCKQDARSKIATGLQSIVARTGMSSSVGSAITSAAGSAFGFGSV